MAIHEYLADVAKEMQAKSVGIKRDFASHRPSAGDNREDIVSAFLSNHLPRKFGISTGMVISHDGMFSNQADLVVVDVLNNAPLHGTSRNKLWPVESVYALIEVKTVLTRPELADAIEKCRRFKGLNRRFCDSGQIQRIQDSLFVIWAFDSPEAETVKKNITDLLKDVPLNEQPDLIMVLGKLTGKSGKFLEVAEIGQPGSPYRSALEAKHGNNLSIIFPHLPVVWDMGDNSLMSWFLDFDAWLRQAGSRSTDPLAYLPIDLVYGSVVN